MKEWKEVKLGDVLELHYGKGLRQADRIDGSVPVYSSAGLTGWHNQNLIESEGIIVGRKGTIGSIFYSSVPFWCIDTAYYILPKPNNYNFQYVFYLLKTLRLNELNEDSAVPGLNRNTAYSQEISLPPLKEQKAIAEVLSNLDDKIELLQKQNETLEQLAETLFRQWFIKEAEEDWEEKTLENFASVIDNRGKTPPWTPNKTLYPIIEVNALTRSSRIVDYSVIKKYVTQQVFNSWFRSHPKKYDTLISTVGSIGEIAMYLIESGSIAQNIVGLSSKIDTPLFLYQTLKYLSPYIKRLDIGAVQPSIKVPHILALRIKYPPKELIISFEKRISSYISKIESNQLQIQTLTEMRDTLLPKLMSGAVRVKLAD